jgi:hypothetical protein
MMEGILTIYEITDGEWSELYTVQNKIVNSGYDLMAKAISGDSDSTVTGMYMQYKNSAPSLSTIPDDRDTDYYFNLSGDDGFVRVSTLANPQFSTTDSTKFANNKVEFFAVSDGSNASGATVIDGTSQFYSLALVAMPDADDRTQDIIFSAAHLVDGAGALAPITKYANSQIGLSWAIKFGS